MLGSHQAGIAYLYRAICWMIGSPPKTRADPKMQSGKPLIYVTILDKALQSGGLR